MTTYQPIKTVFKHIITYNVPKRLLTLCIKHCIYPCQLECYCYRTGTQSHVVSI